MKRELNKSKTKTQVQIRQSDERIHDFFEVNLGYSENDAINEAKRCLDCKHKPCVDGCPVHIDIPRFIDEIINKEFEKAYQVILESSMLPSVCGRVCPQEVQCELKCIRKINGEAVSIGALERFVSDYHYKHEQNIEIPLIKLNKKVAVVGSGPAGLSCAHDLIKYGYDVDIYESLHEAGGVLLYGIPEFRLPKSVLKQEIDHLKRLGVNIYLNKVIGKTITIDELFELGYQAVFLGTGAGLPKFLNISGELYNGVYSANEYLTRINLMKAYDNKSQTPILKPNIVAVIGGGNVALDAARCAIRLGAKKVYIIYRRSLKELPARLEEIEHAIEEKIEFMMLTNLKEIYSNQFGYVNKIRCVKMILGDLDESGRRRPIEDINNQIELEVDQVILAIGTRPNPLIFESSNDIESDSYGCMITIDEFGSTTKDLVFAGGDLVTGSATVIDAMGAGRKAAYKIHQRLTNKSA